MKKFIKLILAIVGVLAIVTCVILAIKIPTTYNDLFNQITNQFNSNDGGEDTPLLQSNSLQELGTYSIDFTTITNGGSGYKSSYITNQSNDKKWYCSMGNGASPTANPPRSFLMGWNNIESVSNGSYDFDTSILPLVSNDLINDGYKLSYLLMDFDFYQNHKITFMVRPFEVLNNTQLYLISSSDIGSTWEFDKQVSNENLIATQNIVIDNTYESENVSFKRYGLLMLSKQQSCRLSLTSFVAESV